MRSVATTTNPNDEQENACRGHEHTIAVFFGIPVRANSEMFVVADPTNEELSEGMKQRGHKQQVRYAFAIQHNFRTLTA